MRIALDSRSVFKGMGGIGRYTWSLLKELGSIDHENEYVCYFTHLEPPEPLGLSPRFRARVFQAGMIDERFDQLVLPALLKEDGVDLYHNPTFSVPVVRTDVRTVATVHDVVFRAHPELVEPRLREYLDRATTRASKGADHIISVSHFSKAELMRLYPVEGDRVSVIHNGVHRPPSCASNPEEGVRELNRHGLGPKSYILYVGSVEAKKNVDVLLRAFRETARGLPDTSLKLALAGARNDANYPLEGRIGELGLRDRVVVLGYVSESFLETLYANALVFVYPSLYEGFGLPALEAMARGVPTVVSDRSSLPEVVGEDAILFDPSRHEDLARALLGLVGSPERRNDLSARGRKRASEFSWRRSAVEHLRVYRSVLKGHESPASRV